MRPIYLTILVLVALALAAWALFWWTDPAPEPPAPSPQAAQVAKDLREKPYTEQGENYSILAAYPTTTPAGEAAALEMQGWVIGEIGRFKDGLTPAHSSLRITYEISSTARTTVYLFKENVDGVISTKSFTYTATTTL